MTGANIEERLARLEDIEAIRAVMMLYADIINKGWGGRIADADRISEVFAVDARWCSKDMGVEANGVDEIARSLVTSTAQIGFSQHVFLNPLITIEGDTASANWLMWIVARRAEGSRLVYLSEDVTYSRTDAGWRIQSLTLEVAGFNPLSDAPNLP